MNTDQIELFLDIVNTGSINKSATNFYITHQSASASIKKLEEEFGYPLFIRSPRGVSLTAEGKKAFNLLKNIYSQYLTLIATNKTDTLALTLEFPRIYTLYSQGSNFKDNIISTVKLRTQIKENSQIINDISDPKEAYLYFFYTFMDTSPISSENPSIHFECFFKDELIAIMNTFHDLSNRSFFTQKDLKKYSFAIYQPYADLIERDHNYFGLEIDLQNIYVTPSSLSSFINLIKSSNIIALLPSLMVKTLSREEKNNIKLQPFKPTVSIYWWYAYSKNNPEDVQNIMKTHIKGIITD